jgi:hypothetical protein
MCPVGVVSPIIFQQVCSQVRPPGDHGHPVRSDRVFFSPKKNRCGAVAGGSPSKKPRCGAVTGGHPRSTGTGDRHRTRSAFWTSPSVTMGVGDGVEDWNSESGEDDGDGVGCEDEVKTKLDTT